MAIKWNKEESNFIIEDIKASPELLKAQVDREYNDGLNHILLQRNSKRNLHKKLMPQPEKIGKIYARVIWKYMQLWMSVNTLDSMEVSFMPMGGINAQEVANKTNKVAEFDYEAMNKFELDLDTKWNVGFYGLGCQVFSGWDELENKPIVNSIDPLSIIPDPQNYQGNNYRYIGFDERFNINELKQDEALFNRERIVSSTSQESDLNKSSRDGARKLNSPLGDNQVVDVYSHYTIFNGRKYLTRWANNRGVLIAIEEIEPRTQAQKKDISRIKYPVVLYRSKVIPFSFYGVSIPDETLQYQDQLSILTNLEMILARKNAMGADKYVNTRHIDMKSIKGKKVGGRYIPVKLEEGETMNQSIYTEPLENSGSMPQYMKSELNRNLQEETGLGSLAFGVSPAGDQTKGEIQTLQKNINNLLNYSTTLLEKSEKIFWEIYYEYYVYNLPASSTKYVVLTKGQGIADINEFKRKDFILDAPVLVRVASKAQETIKKKERFARRQMLAGTILPNLSKGSYGYNEYMRKMLEDGEFSRDEYMKYFNYTPSEVKALEGLELLNTGEKPASPEEGQDYMTFLDIFSLAKDDANKNDIINEYMDAYMGEQLTKTVEEEAPQADGMSRAMAGGMVASEQAGNVPSTQDVV